MKISPTWLREFVALKAAPSKRVHPNRPVTCWRPTRPVRIVVWYSAYPSSSCRAGWVPGQKLSFPRSTPHRAFPLTLRPETPSPHTMRSALLTSGSLARRGPGRKKVQTRLPGLQTTAKPSGDSSPPLGPITAEPTGMLSGVTPRNDTVWKRVSSRTR